MHTRSNSRQRAEIAFSHMQTRPLAKEDAVEEAQPDVRAREAKTRRLREARLASELEASTAGKLHPHPQEGEKA